MLGVTIAAAGAVDVSAHRRDEYLQAARIAIDPDRVQIELDLTPGIAIADAILDDIDRNRDGELSAGEQQTYASLVVAALTLAVDGTRLRMQLEGAKVPGIDAVKRGEGTIRLQLAAPLPRQSAGPHRLLFRNAHSRERSVYLANALVPRSSQVAVVAQRRDVDQTELAIDYVVVGVLHRSVNAWLLASIAVAVVLSALLIRPLRSLR